MNLQQVISEIFSLPEDTFICARKPWSRNSESVLVPYPEDLCIPAHVKADGFEYFLEIYTVREILEPFLEHNPTSEQVFDFVLYYAEYDAFPDWANELCKN